MATQEGSGVIAFNKQKAVLRQKIEEAGKNWHRMTELAEQGLEIDPEWLEAALWLRVACTKIAERDAEHEPWAASMGYISQEVAAENVRYSAMREAEAKRLVYKLARKQKA